MTEIISFFELELVAISMTFFQKHESNYKYSYSDLIEMKNLYFSSNERSVKNLLTALVIAYRYMQHYLKIS